MINGFATTAPKAPLQPFSYDPAPLGNEQVEIAVSYCGICHSDLSMIDNEWGFSQYPFMPGHEVVGRIAAVGSCITHLQVGQTVGLGWYSASCMKCRSCLEGKHNLCQQAEQTMIGRFGGFAQRVRCHWSWAIPLPKGVAVETAGPLFCGGITVFAPIVECGVRPTDRVGVLGIRGLGHMALQFLNKWGCHVTAFTSSDSKHQEALKLGAHHVVNVRDPQQLKSVAGSLNFILSTVNASLDWNAILNVLAPGGRLHFVGAVLEPIPLAAFTLISGHKSVSGSPLGTPAIVMAMLDFCERHRIAPVTEMFPMSRVNDALERLRSGKARYRLVLQNDIGT